MALLVTSTQFCASISPRIFQSFHSRRPRWATWLASNPRLWASSGSLTDRFSSMRKRGGVKHGALRSLVLRAAHCVARPAFVVDRDADAISHRPRLPQSSLA
jgi:hypothetical protein